MSASDPNFDSGETVKLLESLTLIRNEVGESKKVFHGGRLQWCQYCQYCQYYKNQINEGCSTFGRDNALSCRIM